jgi:hypothetical protein
MRKHLLAIAMLLIGVFVPGCGGSSTGTTTAAAGGATTASSTSTAAHSGTTATTGGGSGPLAFAKCMRANGVPNFPDPQPGGGTRFAIPAGANPAAPAFREAQGKCQKLLGGGLPGSGPPASAHTMAKLVRIAVCMRAHGISEFPDPRASMPAHIDPGAYQVITNYDGAILLFPVTLGIGSPAYREALTACGAPPLGLPH